MSTAHLMNVLTHICEQSPNDATLLNEMKFVCSEHLMTIDTILVRQSLSTQSQRAVTRIKNRYKHSPQAITSDMMRLATGVPLLYERSIALTPLSHIDPSDWHRYSAIILPDGFSVVHSERPIDALVEAAQVLTESELSALGRITFSTDIRLTTANTAIVYAYGVPYCYSVSLAAINFGVV